MSSAIGREDTDSAVSLSGLGFIERAQMDLRNKQVENSAPVKRHEIRNLSFTVWPYCAFVWPCKSRWDLRNPAHVRGIPVITRSDHTTSDSDILDPISTVSSRDYP